MYDKIANEALRVLKILSLLLASFIMFAFIAFGVQITRAIGNVNDQPAPEPVIPTEPYYVP